MKLLLMVFSAITLLALGYRFYGALLGRVLRLDDRTPTPARVMDDGVDYVPANKFYLLGQHLSAISAAGPIVGPLLAGMWFGWLPALCWIIFGSILIGGAHDMGSLIASVRHKGNSIAEVIRENMSHRAYILFMVFLWLTIIYIITAFADITAGTFVEATRGAAVTSSSIMYLALAVALGLFLRRFPLPLLVTTLLSVPLVLACIWLGTVLPVTLPAMGMSSRTIWNIFLLAYCFVASIIPVWLLLQPRGYLGGFFLAFTALAAFIGMVIAAATGKIEIVFPAFTGWSNSQGLPLLPILFTTVACGACSGFHAIVSSGTSSKQLAKESDARAVGYGSMLLEGFVALIALATLVILTQGEVSRLKDPNQIYASGIATFLNSLGINRDFALNFALLAFATFVYDTLDVATRLGRYIFQELAGLKGKAAPYIATAATLALPAFFITRVNTDASGAQIPAWKAFWTVFGSSNQLLAALALLGLSVWLYRRKMRFGYLLAPACFMLFVAIWSVLIILGEWYKGVLRGSRSFIDPVGFTGGLLLCLAFMLILEAWDILRQKQGETG